VQKWWSVLFGVVMVATVVLWIIAYPMGWWLPKNVSSYGGRVDNLFFLILAITGFFFILTEALLVYFMFAYAGGAPGHRPGVFGHHYAEKKVFWTAFFKRIARPVTAIIHDQHRLELAWTFVPAVILLFIAIVQIGAWEEIKYYSRMPKPNQDSQQVEVSARQFEWRIRYPSPTRYAEWDKDPAKAVEFADNPHADDIWVVNELHAWKGDKDDTSDKGKVLIHLRTKDVIHSFYLPNLRLKQDALPGKTIPVWFKVFEANTRPEGDHWVDGDGIDPKTGKPKNLEKVWELACAELCGWGHYKMVGRLYVHETRSDFLAWLSQAQQKTFQTKPTPETTTTAAR
jgi:cytochrome c oxidase subunit 2